MAAQFKVIQVDKAKGKSSAKTKTAVNEVSYLLNFNQCISFAMTRAMQDLSDFVSMANLTLVRRDSCLDNVRAEIKNDTLADLRNDPLPALGFSLPTLCIA